MSASQNDDNDYMEAESIPDTEFEDDEDFEDYEKEHQWWEEYDPDTFVGKIIHLICEGETAPHAHLGILLCAVVVVAAVVAVVGG